MIPRNPRYELAKLLGKHYPQTPGLFHPPATMFVTRLRSNFYLYETPEFWVTPESSVGVWHEVISLFNNCGELVEADLELLTQFFTIFPNYFFSLRIALQDMLLPYLATYYIDESIVKIKSAGIDVPNLLCIIMPALSAEQGGQLASFYIDLQIKHYEEKDESSKMEGVGEALLELREFIKEDDLKRYTDFLIGKLTDDEWEAVVQNLVRISFKLTPDKIQSILLHLYRKAFDETQMFLQQKLIRCLTNAKSAEGKPVIFDDVIIEIITKMLNEPSLSTDEVLQKTINEIKNNLSVNAIEKLVVKFIAEFNFKALHTLFDVLSLEQRNKTANCYLHWLQSTKPEFVHYQKNTQAIEQIQIFKEYFDESLSNYVRELIGADKLNVSFARDPILYLQGLIPLALQRQIFFLVIAQFTATTIGDWTFNDLCIVLYNLECVEKKELPKVMHIVFRAVESGNVPLVLARILKDYIVEKNIDIEHYLGKFFDNLYKNFLDADAGSSSSPYFRPLYMRLGSQERQHNLITKYCSALQSKCRSHHDDSNSIVQLFGLLASFHNMPDSSMITISETVKVYFENYEIGKHPKFSEICHQVALFPRHQANDVMLRTLLLEEYLNFIISLTAAMEWIPPDVYRSYLADLYDGLHALHGKSINDSVLKHITSRIQAVHAGWIRAHQGEEKPAFNLVLAEKWMSEYVPIFNLVTQLAGQLSPGENRLQFLPLALGIVIHENPLLKNCANLTKNIFTNQTLEESKCVRHHIETTAADKEISISQKDQLKLLATSYFFQTAYTHLMQETLELIHLVSDRPDLAKLKIIFTYAEKSQKEAMLEHTDLIPVFADNIISNLRLA